MQGRSGKKAKLGVFGLYPGPGRADGGPGVVLVWEGCIGGQYLLY